MAHRGLAIIDVISPCVTFNDHEGSTKSYLFTRQHDVQMTVTDFVPPAEEISATIPAEGVVSIPMHDGATLRFRSVPDGYDPTDRIAVMEHLLASRGRGEIVTDSCASTSSHPICTSSATPLRHRSRRCRTSSSLRVRRLSQASASADPQGAIALYAGSALRACIEKVRSTALEVRSAARTYSARASSLRPTLLSRSALTAWNR